jgi:hypothetical protein
MDDLIYILIGIGWVIFGLYKNYQKQVKKQQTSVKNVTVEDQQPSRVKDIFEQLFPVDEYISANDENQSQEIITTEIESLENEVVYEKYNRDVKTNIINEHKKTSRIFEEEAKEENTIIADFDIRKAIIYSMILERRYS